MRRRYFYQTEGWYNLILRFDATQSGHVSTKRPMPNACFARILVQVSLAIRYQKANYPLSYVHIYRYPRYIYAGTVDGIIANFPVNIALYPFHLQHLCPRKGKRRFTFDLSQDSFEPCQIAVIRCLPRRIFSLISLHR